MNDSKAKKPQKPNENYVAARDSLPNELRPIYDQLVEDYRFCASSRYGAGWVAYHIIADLVKMGWKRGSSG
jgi:hypothetical protein